MANKRLKGDSTLVIPSTKLLCINVHKLQDKMTCDRYYFWRWVLNLIPKRINLNFWFGSVAHTGNETMAKTKKPLRVHRAMEKRSKKILGDYSIDVPTSKEINLQFEIIEAMMDVYMELFPNRKSGFKIIATEVPFAKKLKYSTVIFLGTIDAYGKYMKALAMQELKTASRIDADYFRRLRFDKQVNGYAIGLKSIVGRYPKRCLYPVFRKPGIRVTQKETVPQFLKRLREDLHTREAFYYIPHVHRFSPQAIKSVEMDIEKATFDLACKYDFLSKSELLDPVNWPRDDKRCLDYGTCQYFALCRSPIKWRLYLRFFKMRDIRYTLEKRELDKKITVNTLQRSKIKR